MVRLFFFFQIIFSIKFCNRKKKKKHIAPPPPLSPKELNGCPLTENVMVHKIKTRQNRATPEHLNLYHQHNEKSKLSNLDNNPTRVLISKYIVYIYFIDRSRVHRYGLIILCRVTGYRVYAPPPCFEITEV